MKRSPLACLLLAGIASPALADNLTVEGVVSNPVATSSASNGTAGNITIDVNSGVQVVAPGGAVTLDSNNTIDNLGIIQNANTGGALGVHILGGFTGSFTNEGAEASLINVSGGGTGNAGVLLDGTSAFTGDISLGIGSGLFVNGANSNGVAIKAPLIGNLVMGASTTVTGEGANGILVQAPISGYIATGVGISLAGTDIYTVDKVDPLSGSAVAIGSSVGGGFMNSGSAVQDDGFVTAVLTNSGTAPVVAIQPSIAGSAASDITMGIFADTVNPNLSFLNRGTIHASSNDPGVSTIGIGIGESGAAAHTATLTGGIYNRGSVLVQSVSDNFFATSVAPMPTDATGILIGNGARINAGATSPDALLNVGSIIVAEQGPVSGTATGVLILAGGTFPSLTNTGLLNVNISATDTTIASVAAYGVRDLSGTLTRITNSGNMTAQSTVLDNNAQITIAADLSHGSANQTFTNSGTVNGDIVFGSAGMNGLAAGNQLVIEGASASVQGGVRAAAGGTIDVHVSDGGTGGVFRTAGSQLTGLTIGNAGVVEVALNKNSGTVPVITTTGAVTFGSGAKVSVVPSTFLLDSGTYTLIQSGGTLSIADFATATAQPVPFIYNGSITQNGNNLDLTLQRKTAAQLGLTGNLANIYEPMAAAALTDDTFGAALLTLSSAADVQAAVGVTVPDIAGGVRALSIAMTDQATGVIGARERGLVTAPPDTRNDFRFWGQEFYNIVSAGSTATTPGYGGAGQGVAVGVEWGDLGTGRLGVGYTFFSSQETENHPRDTKTNGDWNMVSLYGGWRAGDVFVTPQVNLGQGDFRNRRTLNVGTVIRTVSSSWSSYVAAGGFTSGYIMDVGGFQIIPEVSLDGLYLKQDAYSENGGGGIGLSLRQQEQQSVRSFAGVLGQGNYTWDNGTLQPQLLVGWSHEFLNSPATIDGSFESTPGSPFHLVGPTLEPNKIIGGASFAYVLGNWSAGINYDAAAASGSLAQSATISLSSRF